jgi:hypothetical protein
MTLLVGYGHSEELALHLAAPHGSWRDLGSEELIEVRLEKGFCCCSMLDGSNRRLT